MIVPGPNATTWISDGDVQPASIDVTLAHSFQVPEDVGGVIDPKDPDTRPMQKVVCEDYFLLDGQSFALGSTQEGVCLPDDVAARVDGRSSIGRLGVLIHVTAGFCDPGFEGQVTLELYNLNDRPIKLYPGMRIGQLVFARTDGACPPYDGKYQHQVGATPSAIEQDF